MRYFGEKFLLYTYNDMYKEKSIQRLKALGDNKYEKLHKYLNKLDYVLQNASDGTLNYFKNKLVSKYIIKEENISSNISCEKKEKYLTGQEESLRAWTDFLINKKLKCDTWIKYWIFKQVVSCGYCSSNKFSKRRKNTLSSFPIFNKEAILSLISYLTELSKRSDINEVCLRRIISDINFSTMYISCLNKVKEKYKITEGKWKTYRNGDYKLLVKDLEDMPINWCIRRRYEASEFLEVGDIKIYYTKDLNGEYEVPRVCIRKAGNEIVEIRGIKDSNQNVEDDMLDVLEEELKNYEGESFFMKKVNDMKMLRDICNKKEDLSKEDLRFLYEIDSTVDGFGEEIGDYRIGILKKNRDVKKDLAKVFDCNPEEVGLDREDLDNDNLKCFYGDIKVDDEKMIKTIPEIVVGNVVSHVYIPSYKLSQLKKVSGRLSLFEQEEFDNIDSNLKVRDFISMNLLPSTEIFNALKKNNKVYTFDDVYREVLVNTKKR